MGAMKELMVRHQEQLEDARGFLVHTGTLEQCEFHGYTFDGDGDLERVWPIAMSERKKGDHGRVPWAADLEAREFTDLLKRAYQDNCGDGCYACNKNEAE